jgi:predicted transcriptional regulator YdeE
MANFIRSGIALLIIGTIGGCQQSVSTNSPSSPSVMPTTSVSPSTVVSSPSPTTSASSVLAPIPLVVPGGATKAAPSSNPSVVALPGVTPSASVIPSGYQVIDEQRKPQFLVDPKLLLSRGNLPKGNVSFSPEKMLAVLTNTRSYFRQHSNADSSIAANGILASQGVTVADTVKTLDFVIATLQSDLKSKKPSRMQNSEFIRKNFRIIKWRAANPKQLDQEKIRITKYAVFTHPGSKTKTDVYNTALYSIKDGTAKAPNYTKQEVLAGIYEKGGKEEGVMEPIAYLTREGLEEALMEGTILIKFTDGSQGFYNVDRSNEIAYVKDLDRKEQKRYWYFKPVPKIKGYGQRIGGKISIEPGVTFAGDILNIGLGKLVVISSEKGMRMGAIADTGGAFLPNLHQLDFLAGTFDGKAAFQQAISNLPEYANAYFLVKK